MRKAVSAAIISDGRILLVRKRDAWILPGGKPEADESDLDCLRREVSEELPEMQLHDLRYFGAFTGITPHQGDELRDEVYFARATGGHTTGAEICDAVWTAFPQNLSTLSDITQKVIASLRQAGYL